MNCSVGSLGTAAAAGAAAVAGSYAAVGTGGGFVVVPVESFVVANTPGVVVLTAIATLGNYASLVAFASALALAVALCAAPVVIARRLVAARAAPSVLGPVLSGTLVWFVLAAVTADPLSATGGGVAAGVVVAAAVGQREAPAPAGRRRLLRAVGSLAGVGVVAYLLGSREESTAPPVDEALAAAADDRLAEAAELELDVAELTPLVTDAEDFYEVDINVINPEVDAASWTLRLTGSVLEERTLTMDDIRSMPVEQRFMTLRCVGDTVNGEKMSTALWTGVPVDALLEQVKPAGTHVMLHATDGYYNEFPLEALRGGLLAYRMNGDPLPNKHGSPLRALVPGHWGEINVKWLTEIEVLSEEEEGYWEKRGWYGTGQAHTVAKLWTETRLDDGRVRVGGPAYAGTRSIDRVEVSVDGGETWDQARLSDPLPDEDVWRQWAYEFELTRDSHEILVRVVESDGTVQPEEENTPQPRGATGWASTVVER
jgi:DMSO/TMAO reductase YedYZ molybdopterin-dependent catalytic subunit